MAHAGAQLDEALDAIGGNEGVAENLVRLLPDAVHAARPLDQPDDGPGQVVVHDDVGILKVLAFGEHVGGDQHAQFIGCLDGVTLIVGRR